MKPSRVRFRQTGGRNQTKRQVGLCRKSQVPPWSSADDSATSRSSRGLLSKRNKRRTNKKATEIEWNVATWNSISFHFRSAIVRLVCCRCHRLHDRMRTCSCKMGFNWRSTGCLRRKMSTGSGNGNTKDFERKETGFAGEIGTISARSVLTLF